MRTIEKPQPGTSEEAADDIVVDCGATETGHGLNQFRVWSFEFRVSQNRRVERGAAQRKRVEGEFALA